MLAALALLVAVLMFVLLKYGVIAWVLLGGYVVMSGITYVAYGADKSAARSGHWRTPESALHLLEIVGGWPGALFAQRRFRHKTRKVSYQVVFWICVALNLGVVLGAALFF
ncbi:MAG TPA: DUF1294 domain-containing protein [Coriobacteriia bacterium]|nr:DUF1294 domain-containing protein [Coriobacteriia bacterium]